MVLGEDEYLANDLDDHLSEINEFVVLRLYKYIWVAGMGQSQ